jgi:hypothetical protein
VSVKKNKRSMAKTKKLRRIIVLVALCIIATVAVVALIHVARIVVRNNIKEGIEGKITWSYGDCMPPVNPYACRETKSVSTKVHIFNRTDEDERKDFDNPIAVVKSDRNGYYKVKLAPGDYDVCIYMDWRGSDSRGYWDCAKPVEDMGTYLQQYKGPIVVKPSALTTTNINVDESTS